MNSSQNVIYLAYLQVYLINLTIHKIFIEWQGVQVSIDDRHIREAPFGYELMCKTRFGEIVIPTGENLCFEQNFNYEVLNIPQMLPNTHYLVPRAFQKCSVLGKRQDFVFILPNEKIIVRRKSFIVEKI